MPYKDESKLMGMDASADTSTELSFSPQEGPFDADNQVTGTIAHAHDEDWIAIKLTAGYTYTITTGGGEGDALNDSILKLMDSKGGLIKMNDDKDPAKGDLSSELKFTPEAGSGTQVYFISVSGYTGNPGVMNTGAYTVKVAQAAVLPEGESADIEGTEKSDKLVGTADSESIAGLAGNDSLDGGPGDDTLLGGPDNDLLKGGPGGDTLKGGDGEDTITYAGSPMGVTINLNDGMARGGDADGDELGEDIENVIGSDHDDTITGDDKIPVTDGVVGGNKLWGMAGNDVLSGREGADMLYGGAGDDMLDGGDEDDTLEGGYGADELTGGRGADTASYASSMMGVTVRLHASQAMGGDAEGDTFVDTTTHTYVIKPDPEEDDTEEVTKTVPDIINLTGSGMADILAGDSRANTIKGGGGNDKIYGGPGGSHDNSDNGDTLEGGDGDDMLFGGWGEDTLKGEAGNDTLNGGPGADTFDGGAGNDMIYADLMDFGNIDGGSNAMGPGDMDTVSFAKLVDMAVGEDGDPFTLGTDAMNIERVIGTDEDDYITGSNDAGEEIEGGDGSDTLIGGTSTGDTVSYESSDRRVRVDLGDGTPGGATGSSNSGGHATGDAISQFENIKGSAYGDVLTARSNDTDNNADGIQGSTLWGLGGDDRLEGGPGDDTLVGGAGADEMDGGVQTGRADTVANSQVNTLSYAGSDAGVMVNLGAAGSDSGGVSGGHAEGDTIETYEYVPPGDDEDEIDVATFVNVTGSDHNDSLTGDLFGNHLTGGAGDDTLRGGAGADVLEGGPDADRMDGGSSKWNHDSATDTDGTGTPDVEHEDWAAYRNAAAGVTLDLSEGEGTGGEAMGDTLKNIELIWGSKHGDTFVASEGADIIHGDGGSDTVSYEASKHGVTVTLNNGQYGNDPATVATETDVFFAATPAIVASWMPGAASPATRPGAVQVADKVTTTKSYAEGDILASIENVTGSRSDDYIAGDGTPNVIKGGGGNDELVGGDGADKLHGGAGNDTLGRRSERPDVDIDGNGDFTDTVDGVDEATTGLDAITDDPGNDMMYGGAGKDKLYGGAGNDTLDGGAGDDDLSGGTAGVDDVDTFVFAPGNGSDVITDFDITSTREFTNPDDSAVTYTLTGDKIDLSAFRIDKDDLPDLISMRAGNIVINLEDYGGGRITIQDPVTGVTVETLGTSIFNDANGAEFGLGDDGSDGIFIL